MSRIASAAIPPTTPPAIAPTLGPREATAVALEIPVVVDGTETVGIALVSAVPLLDDVVLVRLLDTPRLVRVEVELVLVVPALFDARVVLLAVVVREVPVVRVAIAVLVGILEVEESTLARAGSSTISVCLFWRSRGFVSSITFAFLAAETLALRRLRSSRPLCRTGAGASELVTAATSSVVWEASPKLVVVRVKPGTLISLAMRAEREETSKT